ncbi:conserved hypothetical protein [Hyella patelloides LEGE 07179]|uniref:Uncharacterized protein n=1 Tax=Hyella patelloides LEGE 07179 TaxID=945734 RepID=A0A563VVG6_9CYAN|nr:hypothetical protein [Hyella patelloides]VEP15273.1 conserved hypothetical protein [Hyella patelloides LEGE 07179]
MSIELFTAGKLLEIALSAIVGNAATEGTTRLWQTIKNRLLQNQPVIEADIIVELEQNPTEEKLKRLQPYLEQEMQEDRDFAQEITKLAKEVANVSSGDALNMNNPVAKEGGILVGKNEGGININNSSVK